MGFYPTCLLYIGIDNAQNQNTLLMHRKFLPVTNGRRLGQALKTRHPDTLEPYSAGIKTHGLNPNAVKVMAEAGVDISSQKSQLADEFSEINLDTIFLGELSVFSHKCSFR